MKTQHKKQSKTKKEKEDITIVGCCPCNSHKNKRGINKYFYCMNIKIKNKIMAIIFGYIIQTLLYILYVELRAQSSNCGKKNVDNGWAT